MPDGLAVQPVIEIALAKQKASSACCGAPLSRVAPGAEEFTCRSCDRPTERVLSAPQETTHSSERNGNHV
jgi:hypothetical protein